MIFAMKSNETQWNPMKSNEIQWNLMKPKEIISRAPGFKETNIRLQYIDRAIDIEKDFLK